MANYVYIAASLDGYIATPDGGVEWLDDVPNPNKEDFGYSEFISRVDAILMGSGTYEKVLSFGQWPYEKDVYVLSNRIRSVTPELKDKVKIICGTPREVLLNLKKEGIENLYIDGGKVIQSFLRDDLIDELIITRIPKLLGRGLPLFGELDEMKDFAHLETEVINNYMVKSRYVRDHGNDSPEY
jgi:dihydrofolate reductase